MLRLIALLMLLCFSCSGSLPAIHAAEKPSLRSNSKLAFRVESVAGKSVEVAAQSRTQLTVICFLGTECPVARLYGPRLAELSRKFSDQGVQFIGLISNAQDSPAEIQQFGAEHQIAFPLVKDVGNRIADQFGATRISEVFVVDQSLTIRYRGRIDDQYKPGSTRQSATRDDLRLAIQEVLAGKPVTVAQTDAAGCLVGRVKTPVPDSKLTFCNQVARVLAKHCTECHRPGEIGPFDLTKFEEVTGWGETLVETIDSGRMPPWNANPKHGSFANSRLMPEEDKQTIRDWVAAGMPCGSETDLPPQQLTTTEWGLPGQPDVIIPMRDRPFVIPASGTVEYQYFVVDPKFTEDRWISAAQVIPGNRSIVHHCIVFIRPPDGSRMRGVGWLNGYVPGQRGFQMHSGRARKVPAGSKLVFQMHYTPNGTEQQDLTRLGLIFVPEKEVTHEVYSVIALDQEFEIPPQTAGYPVHAQVKRLPRVGELLAIVPHMHVRGQSIQVTSKKGSAENILLDVPRYDFNWQHVYELSHPLDLAEIDSLEFTARFDNSKNNPANPDPTQYVMWGDQTWEEMAVTFFEISEPRTVMDSPKPTAESKSVPHAEPAEKASKVQAFVDDFLKRFDANQDGTVDTAETPLAFRKYAFHRVDSNSDGHITRDEIEAAANERKLK